MMAVGICGLVFRSRLTHSLAHYVLSSLFVSIAYDIVNYARTYHGHIVHIEFRQHLQSIHGVNMAAIEHPELIASFKNGNFPDIGQLMTIYIPSFETKCRFELMTGIPSLFDYEMRPYRVYFAPRPKNLDIEQQIGRAHV